MSDFEVEYSFINEDGSEDSFKRHQESELNNVTSILDFMDQYKQQTEE